MERKAEEGQTLRSLLVRTHLLLERTVGGDLAGDRVERLGDGGLEARQLREVGEPLAKINVAALERSSGWWEKGKQCQLGR